MELKWKHNTLFIENCTMTTSDELLAYFHIAKKMQKQLYQGQRIQVNQQTILHNTPLQRKDLIRIQPFPQYDLEKHLIPCFDPLSILYEDDLFLIVYKPSFMLVHSDGNETETTLYDIVKGYYLLQGLDIPVRAIHRLDKETSGAVIFCKIPLLQPLLDYMLQEKQIDRQYLALCAKVLNDDLTIDKQIGRDRHNAKKMRISKQGKSAKTDVHVITQYQDYTLIACKLYQGRTHQIRVHLASISHPLLHDTLYGNYDKRINRYALHAYRIQLCHPFTQQNITIECPLPTDMKKLVEPINLCNDRSIFKK